MEKPKIRFRKKALFEHHKKLMEEHWKLAKKDPKDPIVRRERSDNRQARMSIMDTIRFFFEWSEAEKIISEMRDYANLS